MIGAEKSSPGVHSKVCECYRFNNFLSIYCYETDIDKAQIPWRWELFLNPLQVFDFWAR